MPAASTSGPHSAKNTAETANAEPVLACTCRTSGKHARGSRRARRRRRRRPAAEVAVAGDVMAAIVPARPSRHRSACVKARVACATAPSRESVGVLRVGSPVGCGWSATAPSSPPPASRRARAMLAYLALHPGPHPRGRLAGGVLARRARRVGPHQPARRAERAAARARAGRRARRRDPRDGRARRRGAGGRRARVRRGAAPRRSRGGARGVPRRRSSTASRTTGRTRRAARTPSGWREALEQLAAASAEPAEAVRLTREQVALDPLAEEPNRRLIERLAAAGDRAAALGAGERFAERLRAHARRSRPRARPASCSTSLRRAPAEPAPPSRSARYDTAFVGRARRARAPARRVGGRDDAPRRRIVLLAGEPGVGKTRLAHASRARCSTRGAPVLLGRCWEEPLAPFEPFAEALRQVGAADVLQPGQESGGRRAPPAVRRRRRRARRARRERGCCW